MGYQVAIRHIPTGEVRMHEYTYKDWEFPNDEWSGDIYMWTEGNYGCGCNLSNFFRGDEEFDECNQDYKALYALLPDGRLVDIEEYGDYIQTGIQREPYTRPEQFTNTSGAQRD